MTKQRLIFLSGDLVFASRMRAACAAAGLELVFGGSLPAPESDASRDADSVRYIVLDLTTRSGIVGTLLEEARARFPQAHCIAYGSHVQKAQLAAAREAGFDEVQTRNRFNAWITELASAPPGIS